MPHSRRLVYVTVTFSIGTTGFCVSIVLSISFI